MGSKGRVAAVNRRLTVLAGALVAAASLSSLTGCATFDRADAVAVVDGHTLSRDEFTNLAESSTLLQAFNAVPSNPLPGASARTVIFAWVLATAADDAGLLTKVNEADAEKLLDTAASGWQDAHADAKALLVDVAKLTLVSQTDTKSYDAFTQQLPTTDVWIASRYGEWRGGEVVALGNG